MAHNLSAFSRKGDRREEGFQLHVGIEFVVSGGPRGSIYGGPRGSIYALESDRGFSESAEEEVLRLGEVVFVGDGVDLVENYFLLRKVAYRVA